MGQQTFLASRRQTPGLRFSKPGQGMHVIAPGGSPFAEASTFANRCGGQVGATSNS